MAERSIDEYTLTQLERVVSGPGAVDRLGAELDRLGVSRAFVVTGRTLGASALLGHVTRALGDRCLWVFTEAHQHVPATSVAALARAFQTHEADGVVSFGGGSPIDTAKAAIYLRLGGDSPSSSSGRQALPHVAVPTTLSAGEFTAVAGITDEQTRIKRAIADPRLAPRVVVLDPALTVETPASLWAASGVRAVDHAVETLYSTHSHPMSEAQAARGLSMLVAHLPPSLEEGRGGLEHRLQCQTAAWMSVVGIAHAGLGLSHALGHQIGPRWGVAHGVTSSIMLPHAMRVIAARAPERFRSIATALGLAFDEGNPTASARACADRVAAFIAGLGLPVRLRDVQAPRAEMDDLARVVHDALADADRAGHLVTFAEIRAVLEAAY
jgi:alcohol dehydrogenase class IV